MRTPSFSIVIPTFNRAERLGACLEALCRLDYPADCFEVVVVDDGTEQRDRLVSVFETFHHRLPLKLIYQKNSGPAAARNHGAKVASMEYLAFTDDDCCPRPGWLREFANHFEKSPNCVAGGYSENALSNNTYSSASQALANYIYGYYINRSTPFIASNNLSLSSEIFHAINGFDERFPLAGGEDREFCARVIDRGYPLDLVQNAVVDHYHPLSLRQFMKQHFNYGRGAFFFRRIVANKEKKPIKFEPFRFYSDLCLYPFSVKGMKKRFQISMLLVLAQMANIAGFLSDKFKTVS